MSNMSYCRFQNTSKDLEDCLDALEDYRISSQEEKTSAKFMMIDFLDYCRDYGVIEDYDKKEIESIIERCK